MCPAFFFFHLFVELVDPDGLFWQSLDAIQAKFELRKKQTEVLRSVIPRRHVRLQPLSVRKPAVPPPPPKRTAFSMGKDSQ